GRRRFCSCVHQPKVAICESSGEGDGSQRVQADESLERGEFRGELFRVTSGRRRTPPLSVLRANAPAASSSAGNPTLPRTARRIFVRHLHTRVAPAPRAANIAPPTRAVPRLRSSPANQCPQAPHRAGCALSSRALLPSIDSYRCNRIPLLHRLAQPDSRGTLDGPRQWPP